MPTNIDLVVALNDKTEVISWEAPRRSLAILAPRYCFQLASDTGCSPEVISAWLNADLVSVVERSTTAPCWAASMLANINSWSRSTCASIQIAEELDAKVGRQASSSSGKVNLATSRHLVADA